MMITIANEILSVSIDTYGAQLRSIKSVTGTEYLWQGDERYWEDSSPVLFPYIARLYDGAYTYLGEKYQMGIHGFAAQSEFEAVEATPCSVTMQLNENTSTLAQYPFRFRFQICYRVENSTLFIQYKVFNRDNKVMPFAVGGHPGFNVPFSEGTKMEDYYLKFREPCTPERVGFTEELFLSGENTIYPLEEENTLRLRHDLFDDDAIVLQNMSQSVTLQSDRTRKRVTVCYPNMPYLGIWHMPHTDAPYVCIEPWTSLPSRQGIVEELTGKPDMQMVYPNEQWENEWSITISEE